MNSRRPEVARATLSRVRLAAGSRVLEIGCGDGTFRLNLPRLIQYIGMDPALDLAPEIRADPRVNCVQATFEETVDRLPLGGFDLIVANDVIEHMHEHQWAMAQIYDLLAPGGLFVGSIPNGRYLYHLWHLLWGKDWHYEDEGIRDRTHLRVFTKKSWHRLLRQHGYVDIRLFGINHIDVASRPAHALPKIALALLLGEDTRYLQFAFRAKKRRWD